MWARYARKIHRAVIHRDPRARILGLQMRYPSFRQASSITSACFPMSDIMYSRNSLSDLIKLQYPSHAQVSSHLDSMNEAPAMSHGYLKLQSTSAPPVEVIDRIVQFMLGYKHDFTIIADFSLVSYQFRQICFRRFFSSLCAFSKYKWANICHIPGVFNWTRLVYTSLPLYHCYASQRAIYGAYMRIYPPI